MSTLLDEVSLVVVPSGYKAGKIYSEIPTGGDGDLTFTRASDATRVNSDGLIESPRTNLVLQSNQFDTTWSNLSITQTSGQTGYDGTLNAWESSFTAGASRAFGQGSIPVGIMNFSIYVKAGTHNFIQFTTSTSANIFANFNISALSGAVGNKGSLVLNSSITSVGGGWYRCSMACDNPSSGTIFVWMVDSNTAGRASAVSTAGSIFIQDAQIETGDIATEYIPTTNSARTTFAGITQDGTSASNVPRLDYSQGSCPALLLEPQRTNLVPNSEQFDNATWLNNGTLVANQGVSPDGYTNADLFYSTTGTGKRIFDTVTITSATTYTSSVFAKASGKSFIWFPDIDNSIISVWFDLSNGTFSTPVEGTATMVDYGNGWYRCSLTTTSTSTTGYSYVGISDASESTAFTQNGTDGVLIWGAQIEQGAYATSYIPTTSATVTRLADRVSRSGLGLTDSTFVLNFRPLNHTVEVLDFQKSGGARMFYIAINSVRFVTFNSVSGGTIGAIGSAITLNETCKLGFTLNASTSNVTVFINGLKIGTYATDITTFDGFDQLETFGFAQGTKVEQILIFPSVLTDTQCIELTTL